MSEIARCPACGKYPMAWTAEKHNATVKIECCDHCIATPAGVEEKWNQYAAAMELARAVGQGDGQEFEKAISELPDVLFAPAMRVLEVFK